MLKSGLWNYSDDYILVSGNITLVGGGENTGATPAGRNNKQVIFKNLHFADCITEINKTQKDIEKDLHVVMPMYNLTAYSDMVNIVIIIEKKIEVYISFTKMSQMII